MLRLSILLSRIRGYEGLYGSSRPGTSFSTRPEYGTIRPLGRKIRLAGKDFSRDRLNLFLIFELTKTFDKDAFLILLKKLVEIDKRWIPKRRGYSLYIRPTIIGTRPGTYKVVL